MKYILITLVYLFSVNLFANSELEPKLNDGEVFYPLCARGECYGYIKLDAPDAGCRIEVTSQDKAHRVYVICPKPDKRTKT